MKKVLCSILAAGLLAWAVPAGAQSRPLVTEDPETVPVGHILLEAGVDFLNGVQYPVSGLTGNLLRLGTLGVSFGVSSIAEIQIDGGLVDRLEITSMNPAAPFAGRYTGGATSTSSFEDVTIGAKIRVLSETETRPAIAIRFATRLPFVGVETGLGTGTTDFAIALAGAKTVQSIRIAANLGIAVMGDPEDGVRQNHLVIYGASLARAVRTGVELVAEFNGRLDTGDDVPPVGTDSRMIVKVGGRFTRGSVRLDAGALLGVTDRDPSWGVTFGATWVFKVFEVR